MDESSFASKLLDKLDEGNKSVVKVKTVVRRPRNILRPEHLVSRKGIVELNQIVKDTKFKGKGHELEDLRTLLFKTKHWAHRLFPALTFEDFIEKAETLGNKKMVKSFQNKIRHNLPLYFAEDHGMFGDDQIEQTKETNSDFEDDQLMLDHPENAPANQNNFDFDKLFQDHVQDMKRLEAEEENERKNKQDEQQQPANTNGQQIEDNFQPAVKSKNNRIVESDEDNVFGDDDDDYDQLLL